MNLVAERDELVSLKTYCDFGLVLIESTKTSVLLHKMTHHDINDRYFNQT